MTSEKCNKIRKECLLFIVLIYFWTFKDWIERIVPIVKYGDEIFALLAVPIWIFELRNKDYQIRIDKKNGYGIFVVLFLITGLISSFICSYQNFFKIALPDLFLCLKFWLAVYVGKVLFKSLSLKKSAKHIYYHIKLITIIYLVLLFIDYNAHIFETTIRYGIRSEQLIYSHPTVLVACCVFLTFILLLIKDYVAGYQKWLIALLVIMCTTLRSKAFGAAMVIILICYFVFYRKEKIRFRTLLLFVPLIILLGWSQIEYYFFSSIISDSARYQLSIKSVEIAKDYFPFGTGFGTFGSYYSGVSYSPVYTLYGLSNINGLRINATTFISDSFWPMILGQTGCVGLVFYAVVIIILFKKIQTLKIISLSSYAAALSGFCYLLIMSASESAFVSPAAMPIAMMFGVVLNQSDKIFETKK